MTITAIENSIRVLESCGELGASDCRRLFDLLPHLDAEGSIEASVACKLLFDEPSADANLWAFLQRVKHAIDTASQAESQRDTAGDAGQQARLAVLQAFQLVSQRKRSDRPKRLAFSALDQPVAISPSVNRSYQPEDYVDPGAAPPEDFGGPGAAPEKLRLFISYTHKNQLLVDLFLDQLKPAAESLGLPPIEYWLDKDIRAGEKPNPRIQKEMRDADYGFALLSQAFFDRDYILDHELTYFLGDENQKRPNLIPITLEGIEKDFDKLRKHVRQKSERDKREAELQQLLDENQWFVLRCFDTKFAFAQCTAAVERKAFVSELLRSAFGDLLKRPTPTAPPPFAIKGLEDISRGGHM